MRTLAVTQNITLDGSIEMLDNWFDDQAQGGAGNEDLLAENERQDSAADALLVGRQTFEDFRGYWRDLEGDTTGISDYLNQVPKYVVSSTLTDPEWQPTTILSGDLLESVRELKDQAGKDIVCTGSIRLTHALLGAGLVDELRLFVYPVVQGRGRRLFPDDVKASRGELLETKQFRNGVGYLRYRLA